MKGVQAMATRQILQTNTRLRKGSRSSGRKMVHKKEPVNDASRPVWAPCFEVIAGQVLEHYLAARRGVDAFLTPEQTEFLASLGTTPQEVYDFVEDWYEYGEPSLETAFRITEVRAEYLRQEQSGQRSMNVVTPDSLPSKTAELGGFVWLPRIIANARAKLRGEMPPDIMYGCGGDRAFLRKVGIDPVRFLQIIWNADEGLESIVEYVKISAEFHSTPVVTPYNN